jgi:dGTPase
MADHGGFNHNQQSLRIVEKLEQRYPSFSGLNLSWEVREGIVKHETVYDRADATGFEPDLRAPLEAQVVNVADETAYTAHDLDDGLRSGLIRPEDLAGLALWEEMLRSTGTAGQPFTEMVRRQVIRRLIGTEVSDVIATTEARLKGAGIATLQDVRRAPGALVCYSDELSAKNRELKTFLYQRLYRHWRVVRMASKAHWYITQLFQAYISQPELLPPDIKERMHEEEPYRVICDYVAGMTDRYALSEYKELYS